MANELEETPPGNSIDVTGLPEPVVQSIKQLVKSLREEIVSEPPPSPAKGPPFRGRFAHLNLSIPNEDIDAAQREAWSGFPRELGKPGNP
jgi:hypothetical protein